MINVCMSRSSLVPLGQLVSGRAGAVVCGDVSSTDNTVDDRDGAEDYEGHASDDDSARCGSSSEGRSKRTVDLLIDRHRRLADGAFVREEEAPDDDREWGDQ